MSLTRRAWLLSALTALGAGLTGCSAPAVVTTQEGGGPTGATASSDATGNALTAADPLPTGAVNAIVCGTDSDRDNTNTDVLVLAQLSADRRQVTLVSVPRDCYVPIAGGPPRKVNAALAEQGVAALSRTVSDLFGGLTVHYVAQTNFADFVKLCAAFDGFSVTNRLASSVTSSVTGKVTTFPAGPLQLHGADWLIYARQRHGLPNGDFDRGERHRAIVAGLVTRAQSVLASGQAPFARLVRDACARVRLHGGLTAGNALGLAAALRAIEAGRLVSLRVPTSGGGPAGEYSDALSVDAARLGELAAGLRAGDVAAYVRAHGVA